MAHFAKVDKTTNKVVRVVPLSDELIKTKTGSDSERLGIEYLNKIHGNQYKWVKTSYNGNIRKRYAVVGGTYNKELDAFIPPQPYDSWVLNTETCNWEAPVPCPEGEGYSWDEKTKQWINT